MDLITKTISTHLQDKGVCHFCLGNALSLDTLHNTLRVYHDEDAIILYENTYCRKRGSEGHRIALSVSDPELLTKVTKWARHKQLHLMVRRMIRKIPMLAPG